MDFIFWIILVMIDLYRSFRPNLSYILKLALKAIKNALPVKHTGRAPRKR